jgi:hypothetical protein
MSIHYKMPEMPKNAQKPDASLTVKLVGPHDQNGDVYLSTLADFCARLQKCLRRAEITVYGTSKNLKYPIKDLRKSSALLTVRAIRKKGAPDKRRAVFGLVSRTVRQIQTGRRPSKKLTSEDIEAYKHLAEVLGRGADRMEIGGTEITSQFIRHADNIISGAIPTTGSVAGVLEKLNVHNERNEFALYPPVPGYEIRCLFAPAMFDEVQRAIKRTVTVTGRMDYENDSPFPSMVRVEKMEIHPLDSELPTILDLRGYAKGCTGDLSAIEFVNNLRNE